MDVVILILTIYFICTVYVLYQMALSAEAKKQNQFSIRLNEEALKAAVDNQLQQQSIYQVAAEVKTEKMKGVGISYLLLSFFQDDQVTGSVRIEVAPLGKKPLEPAIKNLEVKLVNTLPDQQILISWDHSAISVYGQPAQRVIRQVPGQPTDLLHAQAPTIVNPNSQSSYTITSENLLTRPDNQITLSINGALIDFNKVQTMQEAKRQYSLQMLMWVRSIIEPNSPALQILVPFMFQIDVLPDHIALPILGWLLNLNLFNSKSPKKVR